MRALDVLAGASALAAEDTRRTRQLMEMHGIPLGGRPMVSYHDRNGAARRPQIAGWLEDGRSVAYCSDAGTPLIADPGYRLVAMALEAGHRVEALPGASAVLTALSVSGLPTDRFLFAGFPSPKEAARRTALAALARLEMTLIFYESPRRLGQSLAAMAEAFGPDRPAAVARELTKTFEEVARGTLGALAGRYSGDPPKGEIVILVGPAPAAPPDASTLDAALETALGTLSTRDAAREVADRLRLPRRDVYARALTLPRR